MANLGIPIVITSYLLIRFENTSDLIEAISELKNEIQKNVKK
ncbi:MULTISPECIES: YvrJ family protein [Paenibacillus]|uniref:YvrJ family protein n=1 Tax=Paenibacillus lautus TaxID=1401 RepID=A0A1R1AM13_PAELA|nr:YvrJ family protein [Paenibacillus lautus]OME86458.1 YvrJ family protein [Paenibacillus lautus]